MLIKIRDFIGTPIVSLQIGRRVATIGEPIVNPHNLTIVAFYLGDAPANQQSNVLFVSDIRELGEFGAVIDSIDNLMDLHDLARLNEIIGYGFKLPGLHVIDDHKHKMGVVEDYIIESDSFRIEQILVRPKLLQRLSIVDLTISRQQVVSVDNKKLVVRAPSEPVTAPDTIPQTGNSIPFENPFRGSQPEAQTKHA